MIGIIFSFGTQTVEVRVEYSRVLFRTSQLSQFGTIDNIKLDKAGVLKEFPELKDNKEWEKLAREKFKDNIKKMKSEKEISQYIIEDLTKFGYVPRYLQRSGFRPVKL